MPFLRTAWPAVCLWLSVVLAGITLGWWVAWAESRWDSRWDRCDVHFEGNVVGYWCPVAEFRERPPVAP